MSSNKIKSLKLKRSSQRCEPTPAEDISMILAEQTKSHLDRIELSSANQDSPLHSTPKRSLKSSQEPTEIEYRVSPILLPCTQDGGNEIAWDWQSSLTKSSLKLDKNNGEPLGTPKRTTQLQKKRNSNSPLLYKPIKRKLMRNDQQQEMIDKFTAEMKALSEQIKTVPRSIDTGDRMDRIDRLDDELLVQIDIADFADSDEKMEVTTSEDSSSCKNRVNNVKSSMDELFDDSIEESMVRCSQEVEEKLRLESCSSERSSWNSSVPRTSSMSSWHLQQSSRCSSATEKSLEAAKNLSKVVRNEGKAAEEKLVVKNGNKSNEVVSRGSSLSCNLQQTSRCLTAMEKSSNTAPISSKCPKNETKPPPRSGSKVAFQDSKNVNSWSKSLLQESKKPAGISEVPKTTKLNNNLDFSPLEGTQGDFFDIPDDSFDDFIAVCFDDVEQAPADLNTSSSRYGKVYASPHSNNQSENQKKVEKITTNNTLWPPRTSASCDNPQRGTSMASKTAEAGRGFARSASNDSFAKHSDFQGKNQPKPTNHERKFFKTKSLSTSSFEEQSSVSRSSNSSVRKNNGFLTSSASNFQQKAGSIKRNESNRVDKQDDKSGEDASGSQQMQKCTPEEIERKRMEAKMKLEAKRKLLARSSSSGTLTGNGKKMVKR